MKMKTVGILAQSIIIIVYILIGAINISRAINSYIDCRYFLGSVHAMIALWMACGMVRAMFCW